jgi:hypothetical protein
MTRINDKTIMPGAREMIETKIERRLFTSLACIGLIGFLMRVWLENEAASGFGGPAAPMCSEILTFFGGCGSVGFICTVLFGQAGIERTQFWVFLAGIIGAAILFLRMG